MRDAGNSDDPHPTRGPSATQPVQSDSSSYWFQFILVAVHASSSSDGWARARRRHLCGMRELLTTRTRRENRLSSSSYWFQLILVPVHTGSSSYWFQSYLFQFILVLVYTDSNSYWLESWLASCWPGCRSGSARWRGFQYSRSLGSPQSVRFRRFCSGLVVWSPHAFLRGTCACGRLVSACFP